MEKFTTYFKDILKNSQESDVIFISQDKERIPAHKIVLSLTSSFFKNLFMSSATDVIICPQYSSSTIRIFVEFFYTGELLINTGKESQEFIELCQDFDCSDFPVVSELRRNLLEQESNYKASLSEFDVNDDNKNDVETIYFEQNEDLTTKNEKVKEGEYINEEFLLTEISSFPEQKNIFASPETEESRNMKSTTSKHKIHKTLNVKDHTSKKQIVTFPTSTINLIQLRQEQDRFKKRLQDAINFSCRGSKNKNIVKKASKLFGVSEDAIQRNLRGFKNLQSKT